jgi:hypothetical protein
MPFAFVQSSGAAAELAEVGGAGGRLAADARATAEGVGARYNAT